MGRGRDTRPVGRHIVRVGHKTSIGRYFKGGGGAQDLSRPIGRHVMGRGWVTKPHEKTLI